MRLTAQVAILKDKCGLNKPYFTAVYGIFDDVLYEKIRQRYTPDTDNTRLVNVILSESLIKVDMGDHKPHPWIFKYKNVFT